MRTTLCFLFTILSGLWVSAHSQPDTLWTQRIPFGYSVALYGAIELSDGSLAVAGSCSRDGTTQDMFVAKLSRTGQISWSHAFGAPDTNEQANAVVETSDGHLMLIGQSAVNGQPSRTVSFMGIDQQTGDSLWTRNYSPGSQCKGLDGISLSDGNLAAVGYKLGADGSHSDMWLLKVTPTGDTLWTRLYGGSDTDTGSRILPRPGGGFMLAGQTKSAGQGDYDFWLVQTDSSGVQSSAETYGTTNIEKCFGIAIGDSFAYLAGRTQDSSGVANAYMVKRSNAGQRLWARAYNAGFEEEQISGVVARPGGGALCVGWAGDSVATALPWVFRTNDEGTLEQSWIDSSFQQGQYYGIRQLLSGGYLLWGTVTEAGAVRGFVASYTLTGEVRGTVLDQVSGHAVVGAQVSSGMISVTNSQGRYSLDLSPGFHDLNVSGSCVAPQLLRHILVTADSSTTANARVGSPQCHVGQTSVNLLVHNHVPASAPLTVYNSGTGELDFTLAAESLEPDEDWLSFAPSEGVLSPGDSLTVQVQASPDTTDDGVYDYYGVIVVHPISCPDSARRIPVFVSVLDAPQHPQTGPRVFSLLPPYPNPFNPQTTISFSVPFETRVRLTVYDVMGREVTQLTDGIHQAGLHRVSFDGSDLASGVYVVRMESAKFSAAQKMMLLK